VRPDLGVLGKALGNGFPVAAVVGRADVMAHVRETWVSSTLATEQVALAAALAVLDVWEREDVAGHITRTGARMLEELAPLAERAGARLSGIPAMWFLRFEEPERERRFLAALVRHGVLLKRGAYNFPSLAHDEEAVTRTLQAAAAAMAVL